MTNSNQTVLIAVDLEDKTLPRLERSYPNLTHLAGKVILLYVIEKHQIDSVSEEEKSRLIKEKNEQLALFASNIEKNTNIPVMPVLQTGQPAEEILKAATSYGVDLIAMSTHTHIEDDYPEKNELGATVKKVIHQSVKPVFTFNSNVQLKKIRKILLPLDLTAETRQKVTNAIDIAHNLHASIHIVAVFTSSYEEIRNQLEEQMVLARNFIEEAKIPVTTKLITSEKGNRHVAFRILEYADEINADLIMIMTQQETRLEQFFMGSAAQTILRFAKVPVMSIIPKDLSTVILGA
ncbi:MAG: universal stress protein [Chlorobi bacterium]|nr:universal stress protein [Chlorobiota bacterium]